jgi:branched-chain amino acid transport system substrate-binding protein
MVNGKKFEIIVPLYSRLMAKGAGENVKGIFGSTNWHWSLQDEGSRRPSSSPSARSTASRRARPRTPATCRRCSMPTPVHRAGSFNPCAVVEALEGFEFDGMGNGPTLYRAEDHQCFKDVLVVRGKENPTSEFDLLEVVEVTPASRSPTITRRSSAAKPVAGNLQPGRLIADHCRPDRPGSAVRAGPLPTRFDVRGAPRA